MRVLILSLFVLASCASHQTKPNVKYDENLICSLAALEYLKPSRNSAKSKHNPDLVRNEILKITPHVRNCYEAELKNPATHFRELNLCYVVGTDKTGMIEFSNFYSNEEVLSKAFLSCLNDKNKQPNLAQFKEVKVSQPIRLIPATR